MSPEEKNEKKKAYKKPEISHELELETRAGSPIGGAPDIIDLTGAGDVIGGADR